VVSHAQNGFHEKENCQVKMVCLESQELSLVMRDHLGMLGCQVFVREQVMIHHLVMLSVYQGKPFAQVMLSVCQERQEILQYLMKEENQVLWVNSMKVLTSLVLQSFCQVYLQIFASQAPVWVPKCLWCYY
jgi:hypothetical protein